MSDEFPVSRPIPVGSLPATGIEREIVTSDAERTALARKYGLLAVKSFSAVLSATPRAQGVIAVAGNVQAEIVQACVVTLEPVPQSISEEVDARFALPGSAAAREALRTDLDVDVGQSEDPPEVLVSPMLDLGAVAVEHFVLAIDPYPRAPGAELRGEEASRGTTPDSPFAKLAELRSRLRDDG